MSVTSPPATAGLVRVSVASTRRRVDLVLPATLPVAELLPELARSVGVLDAATVHAGYRLLLPDGRRLAPDRGLIGQGVEDGSVLTLSAAADDPLPRVYDDAAEAMADAVEAQLPPWQDEHGSVVAVAAGTLLLVLGAVALLLQGGSHRAGMVAGGIAVVLLAGAIVLARADGRVGRPVTIAWTACVYAAVSALLNVRDTGGGGGELLGLPLAAVGGAVLVCGSVGLIGLTGGGRSLLLPAVVNGAALLAVGLVVHATGWRPAVVSSVLLVFVVLAGGIFPQLVLGLTATRADLASPSAVMPAAAVPLGAIDADRLAADARMAHQLLTGLSATVGVLLVWAVPFAVSLGLWGTLLALAACAAVMLRTRQYRALAEVAAGLVPGAVAVTVAATVALWLHSAWRPATAAALVGVGAVTLVAKPVGALLRDGRLGDAAESASLILLIPLLVLATGALSAVSL